jgi:hypothetical protein
MASRRAGSLFGVHCAERGWTGTILALCLAGCASSVCCKEVHEPKPTVFTTLAGAGAGATAIDANQKPADAGTGEHMIKIPASPKQPAASWPRQNVADYMFTVRSHGGPQLGVDLSAFDWSLQVDARRALVSVELFRSEADTPAQPIGLFRRSIDDQQLAELRQLLQTSQLFEPHPSMKRHPGYTQRQYALLEPPNQPRTQIINNSDEENNLALAPLPRTIDRMLFECQQHPERAVSVAIKRSTRPPGDVFEVTVTNLGIEKVGFTNPRSIFASDVLHRAVLMLAEFPEQIPGESEPLDWKSVPLEALAERPTKEPWVTLEPGAVWNASTVPWNGAAGKRYLAYFSWANYVGEPIVDGVYRIRGRTDSARITFTR